MQPVVCQDKLIAGADRVCVRIVDGGVAALPAPCLRVSHEKNRFRDVAIEHRRRLAAQRSLDAS